MRFGGSSWCVECGLQESMDGVEGYEPQRPQWAELWKHLSPATRTRRLAAAVKREALLKAVATRKPGESERAAVRRLSGMVRSSFRRWQQRYAKYGLDGLVDWRMPPKMPTMPPEARAALCTLRRMDANISVATMVQHLVTVATIFA